jgi:aryl-alcohol dehydrogenase-like predicted oxidoreductase
MKLDDYRLLGRSGLRVSPLSLGTMTFGPDWGWGSDENESRRIFDTYVDRGGNFIDTASVYTDGSSEKLVGAFAREKRNRLVIATKFTCASVKGDPNSGGNHRKNMVQTVEQSLKRLGFDAIDLLYLHAWDGTTPVEEVMRAFDDLVRAGKVHYIGISDTPAWQVARMQTLADLRGWAPFVALQVEYNLVQRTAERDLLPMARALGLGVTPWSPLASGVLTGKYTARDLDHRAEASAQPPDRRRGEGGGGRARALTRTGGHRLDDAAPGGDLAHPRCAHRRAAGGESGRAGGQPDARAGPEAGGGQRHRARVSPRFLAIAPDPRGHLRRRHDRAAFALSPARRCRPTIVDATRAGT